MTAAHPLTRRAPARSVDRDAYAVAHVTAMSVADPSHAALASPPTSVGRAAVLHHYAELLAPLSGLLDIANGERRERWRPAWRRWWRDFGDELHDDHERLYAAALEELGGDSQPSRALLDSAIRAARSRVMVDRAMRGQRLP
jgi:hypothetical protein